MRRSKGSFIFKMLLVALLVGSGALAMKLASTQAPEQEVVTERLDNMQFYKGAFQH